MTLPTSPPFDIYSVQLADMATFLTLPEVNYVGNGSQEGLDGDGNLVLSSGGSFLTTNARAEVTSTVPGVFTFQASFELRGLPTNFGDIAERHIFLGVTDAAGASFGVFVSQIGLLYSGVVHFSGDDIVLDGPVQVLPNSAVLIEKDVSVTVRVAVSFETNTVYVYWTNTADIDLHGHQLRYVLPSFQTSTSITPQPDRSLISVRGTVTELSQIAFSELDLGTGLIIPNLPPRADAGADQALRACAIAKLDGSRSSDPEGSNLTYKWRLVDAPVTSQFCFESTDALTYPEASPSGFTDHIYSLDLADEDAPDPISAGDVIVVDGVVYEIVSTGTDGNGFFVDVGDDIVPDSFSSGHVFKLLRQRGLEGPTRVDPTFLPDKTGLYKLDLVVFDGDLYSEPAITVINVTTSPVPRGIIPDLRFLWDYLSDFWRLVEDRERIEVFWSALGQFAASELLALWQVDYAKSLRDVQRTFQRRWLHYDLLLKEPSQLIELSTVRAVYAGVESSDIPTAGTAGISGEHLDLFLSTQVDPVVIYFSGAGDKTAQEIVDGINALMNAVDSRVVARVVPKRDGTAQRVRIDAPFAFSVSATSTVSIFGTLENKIPKGSLGNVVSSRSYRVEKSLASTGVQEGDFLTVGADTFRISRVIDDPSDSFYFQRITVLDDIPLDAGRDWLISGQATSNSLDFYEAAVTAGDVVTLEILDTETNVMSSLAIPATGSAKATPSIIGVDTTLVGQYLAESRFNVFFFSVLRRQYTPIDPLISDVPYLQDKIKSDDDEAVLRRNIDYFIEEFRGQKCLRFAVDNNVTLDLWEGESPPERLWAETTYLDNRPVIEANFGIPAAFTLDDLSTLPDNVDYLSAVRGLWYAYFNGPTLFNMRAGVQILLGLPYAEVAGTILEIRNDFSATSGRILVQDASGSEIVRTYSYPHGLATEINPTTKLPYAVGDSVKQFAPLVQGADVLDYVKDPKWFEGLLNQGNFTEVEKFFKFMVRVDGDAFNLSALLFVKNFVSRIKPTYTYPLFVVRRALGDTEISVSDVIAHKGRLSLYMGAFFPATNGQAQMWDQARPGGGGFWNQFDTLDGNATPPTYPTPADSVSWGFDEHNLAPREALLASLTTVWGGGAPVVDSIFYADTPIFTAKGAVFIDGGLRSLPQTPGIQIDVDQTTAITATLNKLSLYFRGVGDGATLTWVIEKNGITALTDTFVIPTADGNPDAPQYKFQYTVSLAVVPGDVLTARVSHPTGFNTYVESLGIILGVGQDWSFDTALPAGTYYTYLVL